MPFLQEQHGDGIVFSRDSALAAESGQPDSVFVVGDVCLVVISYGFWTFGEGNAEIKGFRSVFCSGDGFFHVA